MKNKKLKGLVSLIVVVAILSTSLFSIFARPSYTPFITRVEYDYTYNSGYSNDHVTELFFRDKDTASKFADSLTASNSQATLQTLLSTVIGFASVPTGLWLGYWIWADGIEKNNRASNLRTTIYSCSSTQGVRYTQHKYTNHGMVNYTYSSSPWDWSSTVPTLGSPYTLTDIQSYR